MVLDCSSAERLFCVRFRLYRSTVKTDNPPAAVNRYQVSGAGYRVLGVGYGTHKLFAA